MSADRYEINDADHGAIRISHPSAHLPHEFVCIHPGADPWSAFSNGVIRQQSRDIKLLTQMLHDQRLVIDDLEHRRVKVCDENEQLRADLAAAVAERDELRADLATFPNTSAMRECMIATAKENDQLRARLAAIEAAPTVGWLRPYGRGLSTSEPSGERMPQYELIARPAKD